MNAVIAALNNIIDFGKPIQAIPVDQARAALLRIENCDLAITALRQVVENPKNPEALAHAERMLKHIDNYLAKPPKELPKRPVPTLNTADDLV